MCLCPSVWFGHVGSVRESRRVGQTTTHARLGSSPRLCFLHFAYREGVSCLRRWQPATTTITVRTKAGRLMMTWPWKIMSPKVHTVVLSEIESLFSVDSFKHISFRAMHTFLHFGYRKTLFAFALCSNCAGIDASQFDLTAIAGFKGAAEPKALREMRVRPKPGGISGLVSRGATIFWESPSKFRMKKRNNTGSSNGVWTAFEAVYICIFPCVLPSYFFPTETKQNYLPTQSNNVSVS